MISCEKVNLKGSIRNPLS